MGGHLIDFWKQGLRKSTGFIWLQIGTGGKRLCSIVLVTLEFNWRN
jgi:hypothetical protein